MASNFENNIHVLYAARLFAFSQKSIHMGSVHTNQQAVKFTATEITVGFYILYTLKNKELKSE